MQKGRARLKSTQWSLKATGPPEGIPAKKKGGGREGSGMEGGREGNKGRGREEEDRGRRKEGGRGEPKV